MYLLAQWVHGGNFPRFPFGFGRIRSHGAELWTKSKSGNDLFWERGLRANDVNAHEYQQEK